jgi:RecJ-like exonuclease
MAKTNQAAAPEKKCSACTKCDGTGSVNFGPICRFCDGSGQEPPAAVQPVAESSAEDGQEPPAADPA